MDLTQTFRSQVLGPCFESMARSWAMHFASHETLGGPPVHVGPTALAVRNSRTGVNEQRELDVVVAAGDAETPSHRTVTAIGEAKVGERISLRHLLQLEDARVALGQVADSAKLLLFGQHFDTSVLRAAEEREDLEIIDLARIYEGE